MMQAATPPNKRLYKPDVVRNALGQIILRQMKIDLEYFTVKFNAEDSDELTKTWIWLVGADKKVLLLFGDW